MCMSCAKPHAKTGLFFDQCKVKWLFFLQKKLILVAREKLELGSIIFLLAAIYAWGTMLRLSEIVPKLSLHITNVVVFYMLHKMRQNSLDELGSWDRFFFTTIWMPCIIVGRKRGLLYVLFVIPGFYNGHTVIMCNQIIFKMAL